MADTAARAYATTAVLGRLGEADNEQVSAVVGDIFDHTDDNDVDPFAPCGVAERVAFDRYVRERLPAKWRQPITVEGFDRHVGAVIGDAVELRTGWFGESGQILVTCKGFVRQSLLLLKPLRKYCHYYKVNLGEL